MRLTIRSMGGLGGCCTIGPMVASMCPLAATTSNIHRGGSSSSLTPAQPRRAAAPCEVENRPGGGTARATLTVPKSGGSTRGDYPSAFLRWHVYDNAINTYVKSITR